MFHFQSMLFLFTLFILCFSNQLNASTLITNGIKIEDTELAHVVRIKANFDGRFSQSCSATFVSHSTLITAAHCIDSMGSTSTDIEIVRGSGFGAKSIRVFKHPEYHYLNALNDVAVIVFPDDTSSKWSEVSKINPRVGDEITLVGYGKYNHFVRGDGIKRKGFNAINSIDQRINFNAESKPSNSGSLGSGENSGNSLGDSGGPMFDLKTGHLIGIASTVDSTTNLQAQLKCHYANLNLAKHRNFIQSTSFNGAVIEGL